MVDFGVILKKLRTRSGMTQKELAEKIGVTKSVISYYELRDRSPSPEVVIKLANIFHVSVDYLLGREAKQNSMIDISGLSDEDIAVVRTVAEALKRKNEQ